MCFPRELLKPILVLNEQKLPQIKDGGLRYYLIDGLERDDSVEETHFLCREYIFLGHAHGFTAGNNTDWPKTGITVLFDSIFLLNSLLFLD